jgi:molecular chaperone GrpE
MSEQENGRTAGPEREDPAPEDAADDAAPGGAPEAVEPWDEETPGEPEDGDAGGEDPRIRETRDRLLRLAAEFENYKKRVERERVENAVRAQVHLLERLLDPLDDLQRIAEQDAASSTSEALHEGAGLVQRKFLRALEAVGVEEIDAEGKPFDPTIHEALTTVPAATEEEDEIVAQVYQKGYLMKGTLVRPARVVVRKYVG